MTNKTTRICGGCIHLQFDNSYRMDTLRETGISIPKVCAVGSNQVRRFIPLFGSWVLCPAENCPRQQKGTAAEIIDLEWTDERPAGEGYPNQGCENCKNSPEGF